MIGGMGPWAETRPTVKANITRLTAPTTHARLLGWLVPRRSGIVSPATKLWP